MNHFDYYKRVSCNVILLRLIVRASLRTMSFAWVMFISYMRTAEDNEFCLGNVYILHAHR